MRKVLLSVVTLLLLAGNNNEKANITGDYLCTVAEKASIESIHLEGSDPPKARVNDQLPTRFKMRIAVEKNTNDLFRLIEIPYEGADLDPMQWHSNNSIFHSPYIGNGQKFLETGEDAGAFFQFGHTVHVNDDGAFSFYHAGFEYPGGEDINLSVRWGRCKRI